ncbi:MAG: EamA-like transporter family protein [Firmicutes bacterium]|nr:EamA-like transporter family protein [Bacillota bacterium]
MVFLYAFIAVLCLGVAPFFGKSIIVCINPLAAFAIRTIIAALLVTVWLIFSHTYFELRNLSLTFWITVTIEAALAAVFADLAYFYALEKGTINQVALVISCAPLVTLVTGYFFFNELISLKQMIGAFLITSGLVILNMN